MPALRGITVAVGEWYAKTLAICLPRNMRHFEEILVVTTPQDEAVKAVAAGVPGARLFETNDFYAYGARFNKGLCIERAFDVLGRHGHVCILDSDVLLPDALPLSLVKPGRLYGARRRVLEDPSRWRPDLVWASLPLHKDGSAPIGFFQLFSAEDPALAGKPYWYDPTFSHAGGSDAYFMTHWPRANLCVLPFDVLHLGPVDRHWFGCDPAGVELMAAFVTRNGWTRAAAKHDPAAADRVGEIVERVTVPGYAPSDYELPFVRRAKVRQAQET